MKSVILITNPYKDKGNICTNRIIDFMKKSGIAYRNFYRAEEADVYLQNEKKFIPEIILVLGGDGSLIKTARILAKYKVPLVGVNLGKLGFLAVINISDLETALINILEGNYHVDKRVMIQAKVIFDEQERNLSHCLNDVVIKRRNTSRLLTYSLYVNDSRVSEYRADGVIISTPTGSTAYNLSAGGPILTPHNNNIIITPICPHTLTSRSLVVSNDDKITLLFNEEEEREEFKVTMDGQDVYNFNMKAKVEIVKSQTYTHLVKLENTDFFKILSEKL